MAALEHRPPSWIPPAPIVVHRSRRIAAPAAVVWRQIADHERWPEWFTALQRVRVTTGAEGVGGGREVKLAKPTSVTIGEVFTAWEPERTFAFTLVSAPRSLASMAEIIELDETDGATTISYTQGIEPSRGFGWFWKLSRHRLGRELDKALDALAVRVESNPG
jgi:uncharacterized protein YndB with AHSA1/START domain